MQKMLLEHLAVLAFYYRNKPTLLYLQHHVFFTDTVPRLPGEPETSSLSARTAGWHASPPPPLMRWTVIFISLCNRLLCSYSTVRQIKPVSTFTLLKLRNAAENTSKWGGKSKATTTSVKSVPAAGDAGRRACPRGGVTVNCKETMSGLYLADRSPAVNTSWLLYWYR